MGRSNMAMRGRGVVQVHCARTGELLQELRYTNTIVTRVRDMVLTAVRADVARVALGTGTTPPTPGDTALANEVLSLPYTSRIDDASSSSWKLFLSSTTGNGNTFTEIGLKNAGGQLTARALFGASITKTSDMTLTVTHIVEWV